LVGEATASSAPLDDLRAENKRLTELMQALASEMRAEVVDAEYVLTTRVERWADRLEGATKGAEQP
jgi:hypothetical protein